MSIDGLDDVASTINGLDTFATAVDDLDVLGTDYGWVAWGAATWQS